MFIIFSACASGVLTTCGYWGIDVLLLTQRGNPVAVLKSLDDDSHVETRACQYEAFKNRKTEIAKKFVIGKLEGQNEVLKKYGLKRHGYSVNEKVNNAENERQLTGYEGKCSARALFIEALRPDRRKKFKAYAHAHLT